MASDVERLGGDVFAVAESLGVYDRFAQLRFNYIGEDRSYGPKDLYKRESDSVASLDSYSYTN
jgi:hypothetical protein